MKFLMNLIAVFIVVCGFRSWVPKFWAGPLKFKCNGAPLAPEKKMSVLIPESIGANDPWAVDNLDPRAWLAGFM